MALATDVTKSDDGYETLSNLVILFSIDLGLSL